MLFLKHSIILSIHSIDFLLHILGTRTYEGGNLEFDFMGAKVKCPCILVLFAPYLLELSSILHVTVLVFLRLWAITHPMSYEEMHVKMRYISIAMIWVISILVQIVYTFSFFYGMKDVYPIVAKIGLTCFSTLPVLAIVCMYGFLLWKLKKKELKDKQNERTTSKAEKRNQRMNAIVQRLVLFLLICYVPYLIWKYYFDGKVVKKDYPGLEVRI